MQASKIIDSINSEDLKVLFSDRVIELLKALYENASDDYFISFFKNKDSFYNALFKILNSDFYSFYKKIETTKDGISLFGKEALTYIYVVYDVLKKQEYNSELKLSEFWEKSFFTALVAKFLADRFNVRYPDKCFIAGFFSNVSYPYVMAKCSDAPKDIFDNSLHEFDRMKMELNYFGTTHPKISRKILKQFNICNGVLKAVELHHSKNAFKNIDSYLVKSIAEMVYCASTITTLFFDELTSVNDIKSKVIDVLEITECELEKILFELPRKINSVAKLFGFEREIAPSILGVIEGYIEKNRTLSRQNYELKEESLAERDKTTILTKKLEEVNSRLVNIAIKDPLTGVYNRRYLNEYLEGEIARVKRASDNLTIIACDIDHFKRVNDTYGHLEGDIVLKNVVNIMKDTVRKSDLVARTGGEEFIIVCITKNLDDGRIIAEKVRQNIETAEIKIRADLKIKVTMSFGVETYDKNKAPKMSDFIKLADEYLYEAKQTGRNKVCPEV